MESNRQKPTRFFLPANSFSRFSAANSGPVAIILNDQAKRQFCNLGRSERLRVLSALKLVRRGGYAALTGSENLLASADWGPGRSFGYFLAEIADVRLTFIGSASRNQLRLTNMSIVVADPRPDDDGGALADAADRSGAVRDGMETDARTQKSAFTRAVLAPYERAASIEAQRALADLADACGFAGAQDDLYADIAEDRLTDATALLRFSAASLGWRLLTRFAANDRDSRGRALTIS